jgi:hypothetical protein
MEKKIWAGVALLLAAAMGVAMGAAGMLVQVPDREMEATLSTCVPIYYSGLECCK